MNVKHTSPKVVCPLTNKTAPCGLDGLTTEVRELRAEVGRLREVLPQAQQLAHYAEMARQLAPMIESIDAIRTMLAKALDARIDHETVQALGLRLTDVEGRVTRIENK